jgi:hypothetical protein
VDDKTALTRSNAGMRLIAQQMLLNRGELDRLRTFIEQSYSPQALETQAVDERLAALQAIQAQTGKMRVYQVLATEKHHVLALMQPEKGGGFYMNEIKVEADYPHRIIEFRQQPLES